MSNTLETHRRACHKWVAAMATAVLALPLALWPRAASAQELDRSIVVNRFVPLVSMADFPTVEAGGVMPHLHLAVGIFANYQRNPLELFAATGEEITGRLGSVVRDQLSLDVALGFGLFDRVQLGVALPLTVFMTGTGVDELGMPGGGVASRGIGDLRFDVRGLVLELTPEDSIRIRLGAAVDLSIPTGADDEFLGEAGVVPSARLTAGLRWRRLVEAGISIGYRWRPERSSLFNIEVGDEVLFAAAVGVRPVQQLRISAAISGGFGISPFADQLDEAPIELDGFVEWWAFDELAVIAGGGAGIHGGVGSPDARAVLGVRFEPSLSTLFKKRRTPGTGAVLVDADDDGVPDADDLCPDEPEDHDEYEDDDGCPDPDNDRDGLLDGSDACPFIPEDIDGFEDADGCPDLDDDADGVFDDSDVCPTELEDMDGYEDEDGCPDPDNDLDGLLDESDSCPLAAEVINGIDDFDGCPDDGEQRVFVSPEKAAIVVLDRLRFKKKSAALSSDGVILLDEIVTHLVRNPWIRKVRIAVATGPKKELGAKRIGKIRKHLDSKGIPESRVELKGGEKGAAGTLTFEILEGTAPGEGAELPAKDEAAPAKDEVAPAEDAVAPAGDPAAPGT